MATKLGIPAVVKKPTTPARRMSAPLKFTPLGGTKNKVRTPAQIRANAIPKSARQKLKTSISKRRK